MTIATFLSGLVLVGLRLAGIFVFAPMFSSAAIPGRVRAVVVLGMTLTLGPMLVVQTKGPIDLSIISIARECAVSLLFGITISLILELANTAGQIAGLQFSFSLVNLMDPNSNIETSVLSQMFQLLTTTLLIAGGLDRMVLSSFLRTYQTVPLGGSSFRTESAMVLVPLAGGIMLSALQLAAPLLAATILVEISIALFSRLSPQLPVMALTIPAKTILGCLVLAGSLSAWSAYIQSQFVMLLDAAQTSVAHTFGGA